MVNEVGLLVSSNGVEIFMISVFVDLACLQNRLLCVLFGLGVCCFSTIGDFLRNPCVIKLAGERQSKRWRWSAAW